MGYTKRGGVSPTHFMKSSYHSDLIDVLRHMLIITVQFRTGRLRRALRYFDKGMDECYHLLRKWQLEGQNVRT